MKLLYAALNFFFFLSVFAQQHDDYQRLKAVNTKTVRHFNIDGINFSSQTFSNEFSEKGLKKPFRQYNIKESDAKVKDMALPFNNLHVLKSEKLSGQLEAFNSYYFIENKSKTVTIIAFSSFHKLDAEFERRFVNHIINDEIPREVYHEMEIGTIDFAGRELKLGSDCYWTFINTVQCPYNGEMNWSIHQTIESAVKSNENQLLLTKSKKGGKVVSEEDVDIIFEGTETKAKRMVYDFTGVTSLLAGMSGGKTLTVYYVAAKVRDKYVSCCLSYWNNDNKNEDGLAPLLGEVMKLK